MRGETRREEVKWSNEVQSSDMKQQQKLILSTLSNVFLKAIPFPRSHGRLIVFRILSFQFCKHVHLFAGANENRNAIITTTFKLKTTIEESGTSSCEDGEFELVGDLHSIHQASILPNSYTYARLLQKCVEMNDLAEGKLVHAHMIENGFEPDVFVRNSLVNMYAKCGDLAGARREFNKMVERDVVSWNAIIAGYTQHGHGDEVLKLFSQMGKARMKPNQFTFGSVLAAFSNLAALKQGKQVHTHVIKSGFVPDVFVASSLVNMYAKCARVDYARQVFDKMPERSVVSWTTMISGYSQHGYSYEAFQLFELMQRTEMSLNKFTLTSVLSAFTNPDTLEQGKQVHAHTIKTGFESDGSVGNALVTMYADCGSLKDAWQAFENAPRRDLVSWNAIVTGYAQNGHGEEALKLFSQMQCAGLKPNQFTFVSVLKACSIQSTLELGKQVHDHIIKVGFESQIFVGSALVDMYVKCKSLENASQMFYKMPERSVVSWTALIAGYIQNGEGQALELFFQMPKRDLVSWTTVISGYAQHGRCEEALDFFCLMQQAGVKPNQFTLASVLKACASLAALEQGKQLHADMIKSGFELDVFAGTAMVDVYSKCCSMEDARQMFDKMPERSVVLWSGIISGYAQRGNVEDALKFFCQMQEESIEPNQFTISSVLSACANLAVLEQGKQVHTRVTKSGLDSDVFVGSTLVDMYAKCGGIGDARRVFDKLLERNVVSWNAIIVGYAQHGDSEEVLKLFEQMQLTGLKPDQVTFLGLLSACAHAGLVDKGRHYLDSMSRDYGMAPRMDHFTCMVDLLGRAGHLDEAEELIGKMPFEPDSVVWRALLAACTIHGNMELGKRVAEFVLELEPQDDASYVLLSNINAAAGRWEDVAKARKRMKDSGVRKEAGCSWIEVKNRVHTFMVGDRSHPQTEEIYAKLDGLMVQMKEVGYIPDTGFVLHDV